MRKIRILFMFLLIFVFVYNAIADNNSDDKNLFENAKIKLFDRNWQSALETIDLYIKKHPNGRYYKRLVFYKGKCLEELKRYIGALNSYEEYSKFSNNKSLYEEANIAIIDISFRLSINNKKYLLRVINYLKSTTKTIRYYAAFKLSYSKDKKKARLSVPILKNIINNETDIELIDRAKLALMRIDPKLLKFVSKKIKHIENKELHIRIFDKKRNKETLSLNIPFLLAKLALEALPTEDKKLLKKKGYSIDLILEKLVDSGVKLKFEVENIIIEIWLEWNNYFKIKYK